MLDNKKAKPLYIYNDYCLLCRYIVRKWIRELSVVSHQFAEDDIVYNK